MAGYQLKIIIKGSKPPIWRRIIIPDKITFEQLHCIIQEVFGWWDCHLHQFEIPSQYLRIVMDAEEEELWDDKDVLEETVLIDDYINVGDKFLYTYDFGDDWEHLIQVEKRVDEYAQRWPQVVKFKGNSIPEDCGGIYGYYDLCESLSTGISYDPDLDISELEEWADSQGMEEYDMDAVNEVLKEKYTFSKGRKKKAKKISAEKENRYDLENDMSKLYEKINRAASRYKLQTLSEIYLDYSMDELREICRRNGIGGYTGYKKRN